LIKIAGAKVLHIPTYSPDLSPIEECISKIKAILWVIKARTKHKLLNALAKAIKKIAVDDVCSWFADSSYIFSLI